QHVQYPNGREGHRTEVGPLRHDRTHKQAAVASTLDPQAVLAGPLLGYEVFRRSDEVVEDVLLLLLHPGLMPFLAILPTAAQVGHGEHAALFQRDHAAGAEAGAQADIEAAVGVQERRVLAVLRKALAVYDEHGHTRAILAVEEHL